MSLLLRLGDPVQALPVGARDCHTPDVMGVVELCLGCDPRLGHCF